MADLHVSYYAGHEGRFGHELVEFSVHTHPQCRYASLTYTNRSNYRKDEDITKRFHVSLAVVDELRRMVTQSEVLKQSDACWPKKNRDGKQTLTVQMDGETVTLTTAKIRSLSDVQNSEDVSGLTVFYYFVQDVKALVFSLISLHFKIKPV